MKLTDSKQNGSVLVSLLFATVILTTLIYGLMSFSLGTLTRARGRILSLQAQYSAESGADVAIANFNNGNTAYTGTGGEITILTANSYRSTFSVTVVTGANGEKIITSVGKVYAPKTSAQSTYTRNIEVVAQLSTSNYSSGIASRNILYIDSGVKNITARDIYINGFILLNKNTTNLIAQNITVAGKNTTAANCSIDGIGNQIW